MKNKKRISMSKKILFENLINIQIMFFILFQPIIDIGRTFLENRIEIAGISILEIINMLFIGSIAFSFIIKHRRQKKYIIPIFIYGIMFVTYLVFHIWNILQFEQEILHGCDINIIKEIYYIIRVYMIPIIFFFIFLCERPNKRIVVKTLMGLSLIISLNIVLTNIFKVAFISYSSTFEHNKMIEKNIIDWFLNPDYANPSYMTSKGWFYIANQIGIILFMLFPIIFMFLMKSRSKYVYILVILNGIAMIMVGTKVGTVGCIGVLICAIMIWFVFGVILSQFKTRRRDMLFIGGMSVILIMIFIYSPVFKVSEERNEAYEISAMEQNTKEQMQEPIEEPIEYIISEEDIPAQNDKKEFLIEQLENYPYAYGISPEFTELFDVRENYTFWEEVINSDIEKRVNYRNFKIKIYKAVIEKNHNRFDEFLGIGYTSNFPYVEKDFVSQYIWFGYAGLFILIGPYYFIFIYSLGLALKNIKTHFRYENILLGMSILGSSLLAGLAGHLFNGVFSIIIFALVTALFYHFQIYLKCNIRD